MNKVLNSFKQMKVTTQIIFIVVSLLVVFYLIHSFRLKSYKPRLGVFAGYFCIPQGDQPRQILKSFHIVPLFASRCETTGDFGIDSDLDGLCDSDELKKGSSPSESFSKHPAISDRIWWTLSEDQKSRIRSLGQACNRGDQDADLLTNCEEQILISNVYEASNEEETKALYQLTSLNINHPDTDGDGYIDGFEVRFLNTKAPFIFTNEETGIRNAEELLNTWKNRPGRASVEVILKEIESKKSCYEYRLKNFESWISTIGGFGGLTDSNSNIKLDFLIYVLTSSESEPGKASNYGVKLISLDFFENQFADKAINEALKFSPIAGNKR